MRASHTQRRQRQSWNKNTTCTNLLKGLVQKGDVRRDEPNFVCVPLLTIEQMRCAKNRGLIDRLVYALWGLVPEVLFPLGQGKERDERTDVLRRNRVVKIHFCCYTKGRSIFSQHIRSCWYPPALPVKIRGPTS